jgi:SHS2 domain-containing protein
MKNKFKILPHTADVRMLVFGDSFQELFFNALLGMEKILGPIKTNKETDWREFKVESLDTTALLIDFLSEILYLTQTHKEIYNQLEIKKLTETSIEGRVKGIKIEGFSEDIKGVTYHEAYVQQKSDGKWEALVIFDL